MDRHIASSGRQSLVVAAAGSCVAGLLIATPAQNGLLTDAARQQAQYAHRHAIEHALRDHDVDTIHFHGLDFDRYIPETEIPMFATLHLPLDWYSPAAFNHTGVHLVCVSTSQAEKGGGMSVVHNGIDIERFRPAPKRDYVVWMGRICPEKGVHIALEAAHAANVNLLVAGPVHPFESHQQYFRDQVEPLLDSRRQYIGPVSGDDKCRLLASARCLLIPSLVAETSSLVAMEAASSGTPVVAFANGALPEIVEDGVTGFIVTSQGALAEAIELVHEISPEVCRLQAQSRFDSRRMAANYFKLYGSRW